MCISRFVKLRYETEVEMIRAKDLGPEHIGKCITFVASEYFPSGTAAIPGRRVKTKITGFLQERDLNVWDQRAVRLRVQDKWYITYHLSGVEVVV